MAKIALITKYYEKPQSDLALRLNQLRHELSVITHKNLSPPPSKNPPTFISYFNKWSFWESMRLFPRLVLNPPEIWHFIFHDISKETITRAHTSLAAMASLHPASIVVISFFGPISRTPTKVLKPLLQFADAITTCTREDLMRLKRAKCFDIGRTISEVLPPFYWEPVLTQTSLFEPEEDLTRLLSNLRSYVVIPSPEITDPQVIELIKKDNQLVFLAPRPDFDKESNHFYLPLQEASHNLGAILQNGKALLISFSDLSLPELMHYQHLSQRYGTPLIVNPLQLEMLPGLVVDKKNGWVLEKGHRSLSDLLQENPNLTLAQREFSVERSYLEDSGMNDLNRLYQRAFDT